MEGPSGIRRIFRPPSPPAASSEASSEDSSDIKKILFRPPSPPPPDTDDSSADGDYFYPLRTVVFYPIHASVNWAVLESFIGVYGEVAEIKRVFNGDFGCAIVVYRTAAGAYGAVYGLQALKESLSIASRIHLAVLWPLTEFIQADREVGYTSPQRSVVRQERKVLVHLSRHITVVRLRNHLQIFGPTESFQLISSRPDLPPRVQESLPQKRHPSVIVTFKRPLDAIAFVTCYFMVDFGPKLRISSSNNAEVIFISPLSSINIFVPSPPLYEFDIPYNYMSMLYAGYFLNWQTPRRWFTLLNRFTEQGMLPATRLVELDGDVSSIIIATARGSAPLQYFELDFTFVRTLNNGLTLPLRYIIGRERWVSYFMLYLEKEYLNNYTEFTFRTRIRMMNQVFPKLYPNVFARDEFNFAFRQPIPRVLTEVTPDWVKRSRKFLVSRAGSLGKRCCIFAQPYIFLNDPDLYCDTIREWRIPIVIHSRSLGV